MVSLTHWTRNEPGLTEAKEKCQNHHPSQKIIPQISYAGREIFGNGVKVASPSSGIISVSSGLWQSGHSHYGDG